MLVYECFVMQMLYACVVCASCGSSQCCILHDLQFVNLVEDVRGDSYGRGILQSRFHDFLIGSQIVSFCLPHPVAVSTFIICSGLCSGLYIRPYVLL